MAGPKFSPLLTFAIFAIGVLISRAPFMMTTRPASDAKPWADGPMKLVQTPQYATKKVRCSPPPQFDFEHWPER